MRRLSVLLLLLLCPLAISQTEESLLIGPGDVIHVRVFDTPELEQSVRVSDGGDIDLLVGGRVHVGGISPAAAGKVIEQNLVAAKFMIRPHVQVTVEQFTTTSVSVVGEVKNPGTYNINTPRNILTVISMSGGLSDTASRLVSIQRRETKQKITYSLSNDASTAFDAAPLVYPGDTVFVPRAEIVYVIGDVGRPGGYAKTSSSSPITVLEAIALAGGTQPSAVPSKARIMRKNADGSHTTLALGLSDMQKGRKPDEVLQPDDVVYVPFSYIRNTLTGASTIVAAASTAAVYLF
jgi:polysaccharide export outer membrane protein